MQMQMKKVCHISVIRILARANGWPVVSALPSCKLRFLPSWLCGVTKFYPRLCLASVILREVYVYLPTKFCPYNCNKKSLWTLLYIMMEISILNFVGKIKVQKLATFYTCQKKNVRPVLQAGIGRVNPWAGHISSWCSDVVRPSSVTTLG